MIKIKKINKQKGISLPISLFVLMGVLLASAALIRSSELSMAVSSNIGHRTLVSHSNDTAIATATTWLSQNSSTLNNDNSGQGYLSAYPATVVDYTKEESWANAKVLAADSYGNVSSYIIHRMCTQPNTAINGSNAGVQNICATRTVSNSSSRGNSSGYGSVSFSGSARTYFKVIVKTVGAKGASTITETVVAIGS